MTSNDNMDFDRRLAAEKARREREGIDHPGLSGKAHVAYDGFNSTAWILLKPLKKIWDKLDPVVEGAGRLGLRAAPHVAHCMAWTWDKMANKTDTNAGRHFSASFLAKNVAKTVVVATGLSIALPIMGAGMYYGGTLETYNQLYIPVGGVYANQQFVNASKAGEVIAPRDEIFTVLGQTREPDGSLEPLRFDLDYNSYFAVPYDISAGINSLVPFVHITLPYGDAARPDLAASKLQPRSPYGALCDVQSTGFYNRLPRYLRYRLVRWWDLRPEIVRVIGCTQLDKPYDGQLPVPESAPAPSPSVMPAPLEKQGALPAQRTIQTTPIRAASIQTEASRPPSASFMAAMRAQARFNPRLDISSS
jgi:hypothetical protein